MAIRAQPFKMGLHQIQQLKDGVAAKDAVNKSQLDAVSAVASAAVTSVALSGGTTGLTVSGSPVTSSGTITLAGTLEVANGGTGLTTLTANNVILGNGTSTPSFVAPGTSGNVLTSNGTTWTSATPSGTWTLIKKTADESTSSASYVDDAVLKFSVGASKTYSFRGYIVVNAGAGGFRAALNGPASPTLLRVAVGTSTVITAYNTSFNSNAGIVLTAFEFQGTFQNGTNAGTLALRISQNSASGTTTFEKGCYLEWMEIA